MIVSTKAIFISLCMVSCLFKPIKRKDKTPPPSPGVIRRVHIHPGTGVIESVDPVFFIPDIKITTTGE